MIRYYVKADDSMQTDSKKEEDIGFFLYFNWVKEKITKTQAILEKITADN